MIDDTVTGRTYAMTLIKDWKETIKARARADSEFLDAILDELDDKRKGNQGVDINVDYAGVNNILVTIDAETLSLSYSRAQDLYFLLGHTLQDYSLEYDVVEA